MTDRVQTKSKQYPEVPSTSTHGACVPEYFISFQTANNFLKQHALSVYTLSKGPWTARGPCSHLFINDT